jgi:hypothetical protein
MMRKQVLTMIIAALTLVITVLPSPARAQAPEQRVLEYTNGDITVTITLPENYSSCSIEPTSDTISVTGLPAGWSARGYFNVQYTTDAGRQDVQEYSFNSALVPGDQVWEIWYPPATEWPALSNSNPPGVGEIHVGGIAIRVFDEGGNNVPWIKSGSIAGLVGPALNLWDIFCLYRGSIGDTVWKDNNGNGVQEPGEPGIPGVTVELKTPGTDNVCGTGDDVVIGSEVTDDNGKYLFINLPSEQDYCVDPDETTVPPGYSLTTNNDPLFKDLGPGENYRDADFGYQPRYSLGDRVWYDQNQDGIQDPNEPGYNGVTVALYDNATCEGTPFDSTTTAATGPDGFGDGFYQFSGLAAGDYCVQFGNIPPGWSISPVDQGDGTNDSSANGNAQIPNINLSADDPNEDMGVYETGSLGDSVVCASTNEALANIGVSLFEDFNGDGQPDGAAIDTKTTDANGFYQFTGLEVALAGDSNNTTKYIVRVDINDPDLGTCNVPDEPTEYNPPLDSENPNDPDNDFTFQKPSRYSLGDRVWYDQNQDGIQDPNEPGYNGVTVALYDNATCEGTPFDSTTTAATGPGGFGDGFYQFSGLAAGDYCVQFGNIPPGWSISPADQGDGTNDSSANGNAQIPNINLSADDPNEDMGVYETGSLGDSVVCASTNEALANIGVSLFEDFNGDGQPDGAAIDTKTTDANGFYQFTGLEVALAGDSNNTTKYIVRVDINDPDLGTCNVPDEPTEYNPPLGQRKPE